MAVTTYFEPDTISFAKTPMAVGLETDTFTVGTRLVIQLWYEATPYGNDWLFLTEREAIVDADGAVKLQLDRSIREALRYDIPFMDETSYAVAPNVCKRVKILYGQKDADSMQYVASLFHTDLSDGAPQYLGWVPLAEPLEVGQNYLMYLHSGNLSLAGANITGRVGAYNENFNYPTLQNNQVTMLMTSADQAYEEIRIPANVQAELYKNPVTFTESNPFWCLLGAESLMVFGYRGYDTGAAFNQAFDLAFDS